MGLGVIVGLITYAFVSTHYKHRAEEFNLADIEQMESATLVYDRNGELFGRFFLQNRIPVTGDQISPLMREAVIAAEDNRFYEHDGADLWGIFRALLKNSKAGKKKQGASTVTQQLARNSFDLHAQTYDRKVLEIFLANRIEKRFSKDEIMTLYLNRVYFGSGFYGVEAAARGYFGVSAKELNAGQAAMLAGLLKSPNGLSPWNNPDGARNAREFVLGRMHDMGFLSSDELKSEQAALLITKRRSNPHKVSYAVDHVRQQAITALGYERAMNGGFKITTTFDMGMQRTAETALRAKLSEVESRPDYDHETYTKFVDRFKPYDDILRRGGFPGDPPAPLYLQGSVIAIDNRTGAILTLVGGREFKHSEYNRAIQARLPAGTVFTPIVLAAALEKGIFPGDLVQDSALDNRYVGIGGTTGILGEWGVERGGNTYEGGIPIHEAIAKGKNAATVRLGLMTGLDAVKETARKAGIKSPLRSLANTFLGASEVTLEELTLAYTAFAGGGTRPKKPYVIDRIVDASGTEVFKTKVERVPAVADSTAYQVTSVLDDALHLGTGVNAVNKYHLGNFPAAAKTGTAYNFSDTYTVGYTNAVTCGVWVGFDKPTRIFRGAFGNDLALPIWTQVMNASAQEFKPTAFARPDSVIPVSICRVSGLLETGRCEEKTTDPQTGAERTQKTSYIEYATAKNKPTIPCDIHGTGLRVYARQEEESDWPKAQMAVDLSTVRPVAVGAPALVALNDVYHSVKPAALRIKGDEIRVARAELVNAEVAENAIAESKSDTTPVKRAQSVTPGAEPIPVPAPAAQEVRRAQVVGPLDVPAGTDPIPLETPEPIQF
jgi:membrane carboxypeptidase/penicillin-binding protein